VKLADALEVPIFLNTNTTLKIITITGIFGELSAGMFGVFMEVYVS
jgi:hypothetical protein